jgi:hypothetical protein
VCDEETRIKESDDDSCTFFFCILITPHYYSLFLSSTSFTVFVVRVLGYFTVLDV